MLEEILSVLLAGPAWGVALKLVAVVAGFVLGVRLLAAGGRTADDRDRTLSDAARRHRPN
jgi:UPF0716 family protein affecting phage T7 exclusion